MCNKIKVKVPEIKEEIKAFNKKVNDEKQKEIQKKKTKKMGKIKLAQKCANIFLEIGVDLLRNNVFYDILVKNTNWEKIMIEVVAGVIYKDNKFLIAQRNLKKAQ